MKFALICLGLLIAGCASKPNIQRDCKAIGDGGFYQCEEYPWYKQDCNRFH